MGGTNDTTPTTVVAYQINQSIVGIAGSKGAVGQAGETGGTGLSISNELDVTIDPAATIVGGVGGDGGAIYGPPYYLIYRGWNRNLYGFAPAGQGGVGLYLRDAYSMNFGTIVGGSQGFGSNSGGSILSGGEGVFLNNTTLVNKSTISGGLGTYGNGGVGVVLDSGVLINDGTISGGAGAQQGDSVYFEGVGTLIAGPGAVFDGAIAAAMGSDLSLEGSFGNGVTLNFRSVITVTSSGTISGSGCTSTNGYTISGSGITLGATSTLFNAGLISGNAGYQDAYNGKYPVNFGGEGGTGAYVLGLLSNNGTIQGGAGGPGGGSGGGGFGGAGVKLGAEGMLLNYGLVVGGTGGTGRVSGFGGTGIEIDAGGTLLNHGLVSGGAGGPVGQITGFLGGGGIGIVVDGGNLVNAGTVAGGTGDDQNYAVSFSTRGGALTVDPGAVFEGAVVGKYSTLVLAGTAAGTLDMGASFSGFSDILFAPGAEWVLDGTAPVFEGAQSIAGFSVGDVIDLQGLTVSGSSFGNGQLTLYNSGSVLGTLNFDGVSLAAGEAFYAYDDGAGGTNLALAQPETLTIGFGTQVSNPSIGLAEDFYVDIGGRMSNPLIQGGTLELSGGAAVLGGISFSGTGGRLVVDGGVAPKNPINGFVPGDTIELTGVPSGTGDTATVTAPGMVVLDAEGTFYTLNIVGAVTGDSFAVTGDLAVTEVTCFLAGTRIALARGAKTVERLKIGDMVKTRHGLEPVKWVGKRGYAAPFALRNPDVQPVCIKAGALGRGVPRRDLWVSPGHAVCVGDVLIHAGRLVNGVSVLQPMDVDMVRYFHVELTGHEVIFAEGAAVESFADEHFRKQFENAAEFQALYPGQVAVARALPVVEDGWLLQAAWRHVARLAGVIEEKGLGVLRGCVDEALDFVRGWAQDLAAPERPVELIVTVGGVYAGHVLANKFRPDLRAAGLGSGRHGFHLSLPAGLQGRVQVRRACDGMEILQALAA